MSSCGEEGYGVGEEGKERDFCFATTSALEKGSIV